MAALEHLQHLDLFVHARIAEAQTNEEAVELGLRQGERAFVVDRVLRGHDQKRRRQFDVSCRRR